MKRRVLITVDADIWKLAREIDVDKSDLINEFLKHWIMTRSFKKSVMAAIKRDVIQQIIKELKKLEVE